MKDMERMKRSFGELSHRVIGCALEVHRVLGPGLLESTYRRCLARESEIEGVPYQTEDPLPVEYKGMQLDCGYRADLMIGDELIVELKATETIKGIHEAQLLTYMRLADIREGLLISSNVQLPKDGLRSVVL